MDMRFEYVDLPYKVKALVTQSCESDGDYYTILVNSRCSAEQVREAVKHEISHIENDDFHSLLSVAELELLRHA